MLLFFALVLSSAQAGLPLVIPEECHTVNMTGVACCELITDNCTASVGTLAFCNVEDTSEGTAVTKLILEACGFTGELPDFSMMYSLKLLDLSGNSFSSLGNLTAFIGLNALRTLDLSEMSSTLYGQEFPTTEYLPGTIRYIDFHDNGFNGTVPSGLFGGDLIALDLSDNQLTGPLPAELSSTLTLQYLNLNNNPLGGSMVSLMSLSVLEELYLTNCELTGDIYNAWLPKLKRLEVLNLDNNKLVGSLPPFGMSEFPMPYLVEINLSGNQLSGFIPAEDYINLPLLQILNLSNNQLTGGVPSDIGDSGLLTGLKILDLSGNQLTGTIPSTLGGTESPLEHLDVSNNLLTGSIPKMLYSIPALYYLDVSDNSLTGGLPEVDIESEFLAIQHLAVNNNSIGGEIPTTLGDLSQTLTYLNLGYNYFSGEMPSSFISFKSIVNFTLDLGGNLALTCPVTDYSNYATYTDWGTYGTSGSDNCGVQYASPSPTQSPNHSGSHKLSAGFIILIIIGVFAVITGIIYWRWNAGKMSSAVQSRVYDNGLASSDAIAYQTDFKTTGSSGQRSILEEAKRNSSYREL